MHELKKEAPSGKKFGARGAPQHGDKKIEVQDAGDLAEAVGTKKRVFYLHKK